MSCVCVTRDLHVWCDDIRIVSEFDKLNESVRRYWSILLRLNRCWTVLQHHTSSSTSVPAASGLMTPEDVSLSFNDVETLLRDCIALQSIISIDEYPHAARQTISYLPALIESIRMM